MKVRTPSHILQTINKKKMYNIVKTELFQCFRPAVKNPLPYIDHWGCLHSGIKEEGCHWRQANPISDSFGWQGHQWVSYSVLMYTGTANGVRVSGVDELKPGWFYIQFTNHDTQETTIIAQAENWFKIIERGCQLLGYLPTGDPFAHCGGKEHVPVFGEEFFPEGYPTQKEFYAQFKKANGESMSGI